MRRRVDGPVGLLHFTGTGIGSDQPRQLQQLALVRVALEQGPHGQLFGGLLHRYDVYGR